MDLKKAIVAALVGCFAATGLASAKPHPRVREVNARYHVQGGRIRQGVRSGQLSKGETRTLRVERHAFKGEEHAMRKADNGHLTKGDKRVLNHQENKMSRQIYRYKHN